MAYTWGSHPSLYADARVRGLKTVRRSFSALSKPPPSKLLTRGLAQHGLLTLTLRLGRGPRHREPSQFAVNASDLVTESH